MSTTINAGYTITVDRDGVSLHRGGETLTVEPSDLVDGGWSLEDCDRDHCADGDCPACPYCDEGNPPSGAVALERWHNDQGHMGKLALCYEEPCKSVADGLGVWGG